MTASETRAAKLEPALQLCKDENVISPEMIVVYRSKTPTERLQIAFDMWRSARKIVLADVRQQHPQWSEDRQQAEVARRMFDGLV